MVATTRLRVDYIGVGAMLCVPWMQAEMRRRAELVRAEAERIAPVATEGDDPGEYKRSFVASSGVDTTGATARAYGRVENTSPEALPVEYGWRATPKYRVLGRALVAASDTGITPYQGDPTRSHRRIKSDERDARRAARRARRRGGT